MLVCECKHSESLTKIIFGDDLVQISKAETQYQGKSHEGMKLYLVKAHGLLVVHPGGRKFSP